MKTFARTVTAIVGFAALAISAKAQEPDQLVIHIPHEFVVYGKTLPAGTYRVNRTEPAAEEQLVLRSVKNGEGVLVVPSLVEDGRAGKLGFVFEEIAGQHFLTTIETAEHVFAVPVSKSEILEAANKSHQASKGSADSGN